MLIEELISPEVPTLLPTDTGARALFLMDEAHLTQLPLVKDNEYLGLIAENDLLDLENTDRMLDSASFSDYRPAISVTGHPFEALRIANEENLNVLPVIDASQHYLGSITRNNLLRFITVNSSLDTPGGIIILQLEPRQYSLSEIARICESEDVTIVASQMHTIAETGFMEVTLKTNKTNLEALISSFDRHEYTIKEVFGAVSGADDVMDRYRLLMNYINM